MHLAPVEQVEASGVNCEGGDQVVRDSFRRVSELPQGITQRRQEDGQPVLIRASGIAN